MGLRDWLRRGPGDEEMREELEAHLAMRAEHDGVEGAAARARLGGELWTREEMRDVWRWGWLEAAVRDVRFTLNTWRRHPGFAMAAIGTLALGLGAAAGMFSMVDRILFRPLPYPDGERIVSVGLMAPLDANEFLLSPDYVHLWKKTPEPFEAVTTVTAGTQECDLTEDAPERLRCAGVEWNLLRALRMRVAAGRDFAPEEDVAGAPRVALISHGLWRRKFGGDAGIEGKRLTIDGKPVLVAGVLPEGFELPTLAEADVVWPQQLPVLPLGRPGAMTFLRGFARLKEGVTAAQASAALQPLFQEMLKNVPPSFRKEVTLRVRGLRDRQMGEARKAAWLLLAAVGALLSIACVNVANLLLARMAARERELGVRASLGASKGRLAALVLTESLMLAAAGAALGLGVAYGLVRVFVAMAPAGIPKLAQASLDWRVLAAAGGAALVAATGIGMAPAWWAARMRGLHGERSTGGVRPWARMAMVSAQVAVTFALLGSCALVLRSLWKMESVPLGFDTSHVLSAGVTLNPAKYGTPERQMEFFERLLERARRAPGVQAAALSDSLPPSGPMGSMIFARIAVEGRPLPENGTGGMVAWRGVTPGYFEALRIPMVRGRGFVEGDRTGVETAMVLSERLERKLFPGESALGKRLSPGGLETPWHVVVGIARDTRNAGLAAEGDPEYYVVRRAEARGARRRLFLVVRAQGEPGATARWLKAEIAGMDGQLPVKFETMEERAGELAARPRFTAWLLAAFAGVALALAAMGLAGVASYLVTQRRRDIGVRMALGATPARIRNAVLSEAGRWIGVGLVCGAALAWGAARFLAAFLFGTQAWDPASWAVSLGVLAVALVAAVLAPARRAARVDPVRALRSE